MNVCAQTPKKLTRLGSLAIIALLLSSILHLLCAPSFPFEDETVVHPAHFKLSLTFDVTPLQFVRRRKSEGKAELGRQHAGTKGLREEEDDETPCPLNVMLFIFKLLTN